MLLAAIFLGLCFAKGNWQLQYRVQFTSEILLLEMKPKGFDFFYSCLDKFSVRFQNCTHIDIIPSCLFMFLGFFFLSISNHFTFIYLPVFHYAHHIASLSHFTTLLCSFFIVLFFFPITPFISIFYPSSSACSLMPPFNPASHMLLFCLSALTVSLAGLGNSVLCAPLSCGELFNQHDMGLYSYVNWNYTLQNTVF